MLMTILHRMRTAYFSTINGALDVLNNGNISGLWTDLILFRSMEIHPKSSFIRMTNMNSQPLLQLLTIFLKPYLSCNLLLDHS